jgi:hypothetical protein
MQRRFSGPDDTPPHQTLNGAASFIENPLCRICVQMPFDSCARARKCRSSVGRGGKDPEKRKPGPNGVSSEKEPCYDHRRYRDPVAGINRVRSRSSRRINERAIEVQQCKQYREPIPNSQSPAGADHPRRDYRIFFLFGQKPHAKALKREAGKLIGAMRRGNIGRTCGCTGSRVPPADRGRAVLIICRRARRGYAIRLDFPRGLRNRMARR